VQGQLLEQGQLQELERQWEQGLWLEEDHLPTQRPLRQLQPPIPDRVLEQ
jgi:hypothetical protein